MKNPNSLSYDEVASLYSKHRPWLLGLCRQKLSCDEKAMDMVQNTFLKLLLKRNEVKEILKPRAYLLTITYGLINDHWRRQNIEYAYLSTLKQLPKSFYPSQEERYEMLETLTSIDTMLDHLNERPREAFLLSQLDGWTYRDIADYIGVSERMVKKYMAKVMLQCLKIKNLSD